MIMRISGIIYPNTLVMIGGKAMVIVQISSQVSYSHA